MPGSHSFQRADNLDVDSTTNIYLNDMSTVTSQRLGSRSSHTCLPWRQGHPGDSAVLRTTVACQRPRVGSGGTSRYWHRFVRKKESGIARAWKKQQLANLKTRDQTMGSWNGVLGEGRDSRAGRSGRVPQLPRDSGSVES